MPSKQVEDTYNAMTPEQRANWGKRSSAPKGEDVLISALVAAYHNASRQLLNSEDLEAGHRAGVRDVAVRLGVYDRFCAALD
jgi:hypothetical protein